MKSGEVTNIISILSYRLRKQEVDTAINRIRYPQKGEINNKLEQIQQSFDNFYKVLYSQPKSNNDLQIDSYLASLDLVRGTKF